MIEIAGGIIVALLILGLLPYIYVAISFTAGIALMIAITFGFGWAVWAGGESAGGLAIELILGGVFLIWLAYEIKARSSVSKDVGSATQLKQ